MASARMPDEWLDTLAPDLPPDQPVGPKVVLTTGARWEDVPTELGCSGRSAHRRLRAWEEAGMWDRLQAELQRLLKRAGKLDPGTVVIDGVTVRASGGEATGPSPVDRSKPGTKHTFMVDRHGMPLAIRTAGANACDHTQIIPLVLDFPERNEPNRPKESSDATASTGRSVDVNIPAVQQK